MLHKYTGCPPLSALVFETISDWEICPGDQSVIRPNDVMTLISGLSRVGPIILSGLTKFPRATFGQSR